MHNKPIKHARILALASLCLLFFQTSSKAQPVSLGWDLLTTDPATLIDGFNWAGVPLGTYNFGGSIGVQNVGQTDTIMQRLGTSGNGQTIPLQVNAMTLVSTTPIDLNGDLGYLTLDPNYTSDGTITINSDGTFSSTLDVYFDIHFGSLDGPLDTSGEMMDITDSGNWMPDAPSDALLIPGVNCLLNGTDTSDDLWLDAVRYQGLTDTIIQRPTSSPEPRTLTLLGLGLAAATLRICRRRA